MILETARMREIEREIEREIKTVFLEIIPFVISYTFLLKTYMPGSAMTARNPNTKIRPNKTVQDSDNAKPRMLPTGK